jgi:hypothetical protein
MHALLSHLVYLVLALRLGVVIANDDMRICNAWGRICALLLCWVGGRTFFLVSPSLGFTCGEWVPC